MRHPPHCGYVLGLKPPLLRQLADGIPLRREKLPNNADFFSPLGHGRQLKELNIVKYGESLVQNRM
jgi:hypothetical protein